MYSELANQLTHAQTAETIRCVFLTGHRDCFCAGNDIQDFIQSAKPSSDSPVLGFLRALAANKKPLIVAANGPCIGIGATLLLHCDLVFLGKNAVLKMPFVDLGLCPEAGASLLLPKIVGPARSSELLLQGKSLSALEAKSWGLANDVANDDSYQVLGLQAANTLAEKPNKALMLSRKLTRQYLTEGLAARIEEEAIEFTRCSKSPEAMQAFMRFMSKGQS